MTTLSSRWLPEVAARSWNTSHRVLLGTLDGSRSRQLGLWGWHPLGMAYLGNLTCGDCGLTFTARWGSVRGADEYRCENDHVAFVEVETKTVLSFDGIPTHDFPGAGRTLLELNGLCPACETELATGLLPVCPICGGRDHEVLMEGTLG